MRRCAVVTRPAWRRYRIRGTASHLSYPRRRSLDPAARGSRRAGGSTQPGRRHGPHWRVKHLTTSLRGPWSLVLSSSCRRCDAQDRDFVRRVERANPPMVDMAVVETLPVHHASPPPPVSHVRVLGLDRSVVRARQRPQPTSDGLHGHRIATPVRVVAPRRSSHDTGTSANSGQGRPRPGVPRSGRRGWPARRTSSARR
jgi:hypothetical protein